MPRAPWQRSLRCLAEAPPASVRLVCFPHAGGAASAYRRWLQHLPEEIGLWAVQPPGREDRLGEQIPSEIPDLARDAAEAIQWLTDRPYALFGHSMGALVAYETVRILEEQNHSRPRRLIVSSCLPPGVRPPAPTAALSSEHLLYITGEFGEPASMNRESDLRDLSSRAMEEDLTALRRYEHDTSTIQCPITTLVGGQDAEVSISSMSSWRSRTTGDTDGQVFAGGHFYLFDRPGDVLATIRDRLGQDARDRPRRTKGWTGGADWLSA